MKYKLLYSLILITFLCECKHSTQANKAPEWTKNLVIYEVMPKQYSEKKNFTGIMEDLERIQTLFFNAICLLPVQERDESNNAFNPNSPFALKSFTDIDAGLGTTEQLNLLIDSAHYRNIKVLIEWNFTGTGPHHIWRKEKPQYYLSDSQIINKHYNQDYVKFNLSNNSLLKELRSELKSFLKVNKFDGVVFYNLDQMPAEFVHQLLDEMNDLRPLLIINHSNSFIPNAHYNVNNNLYQKFQQAYEGKLNVTEFSTMLDTINKLPVINYVQDYLKNEKYGPDANVFYNAYKYYHMLTYFLPGIPWVLNGQEDPQFETLNLFSGKPFSQKYKYNNDFYRSLNRLRQQNPCFWNDNPQNLPVKISDSNDVLALERTAGKYSCVGLFNLTDHAVTYSIKKDYTLYYDAFNKMQVSFPKDKELNLGPYQALIITNAP